jgi:hypothetical protein
MRVRIAEIKLGFLLKYISGFVFAIICYIEAVALFGVLTCVTLPAAELIFGFMAGGGLFVGIPIGAVIGFYLIDKLVLGTDVLKRQIIIGFMAGAAASVLLAILRLCGVEIFYRLPYDSPDGVLGGAGIFYIVGVLAALLGYTSAGFKEQTLTEIMNSFWPKVIIGSLLEYVSGFIFAMICFIAAIQVSLALAIEGAMAYYVGAGTLVSIIPLGAVIGIFLVDKFLLRSSILKRQIISGFLTGAITSAFLMIVVFNGEEILSRFPYDREGSGIGLLYRICVLAALLGYAIAGLTKHKSVPRRLLVGIPVKIIEPVKDAKKRSRLATSSLICAVGAIISIVVSSFFKFFGFVKFCRWLFGFFFFGSFLLAAVAAVLGIMALIFIASKHKKLKSDWYAISAIFLVMPLIIFLAMGIHRGRHRMKIAKNVTGVYLGMTVVGYAKANDGYFPDVNQWCDLLIKQNRNLSKDYFRYPSSKPEIYNYAYNQNLSGLRIDNIKDNIVLIFEAEGGWNLAGTEELLEKTPVDRQYVYVYFSDGNTVHPLSTKSNLYKSVHWKP